MAFLPPKDLRQAFLHLEAHQNIIARCSQEWQSLDQHFSQIEASLHTSFAQLLEKEKAFQAEIMEAKAALEKRDGAVASREEASLARVQEQKDAAIAAILEQKRKWKEERQQEGAVERVTSTKKEKEEPAREQAMEVEEAGVKPAEEANEGKEASQKEKEDPKPAVVARPQLKSLCENMDGAGLRKYVAEQKNETNTLRAELPSALSSAIDPARLVLKALEGYHSSDPIQAQSKKKDKGPPSHRRACILLLESLADVLADHPVPSNIKSSAKEIADVWKSKLTLDEKDAMALWDTQSLLLLLATFGLASDFHEDELCKLVVFISKRKDTPALCRSLGMAAKIPDVVEELIKDGKPIEALSFAHEFGLFEQFRPVPLLKSFVKEAREATQASLKDGNQSSAEQSEHHVRELAAMRAVLKCINEYKLEAQYFSLSLHKRIAELDRKPEKKRPAKSFKFQGKKPRSNGVGGIPQAGSAFRPPQYGGGHAPSSGLPAHNYGLGHAGVYAHPADGLGSLYGNPSFSYGTYQYGAGPPSAYQRAYL